MDSLKNILVKILRRSEQYTRTDMVYVAKNTFWINANTVIITIMSLGLSLAFARFVSKETYGIYQFLISISSIVGAFTLTGMNTAVTQAVARGFDNVYKEAVWVQIKFSLISLLVASGIGTYYFLQGNTVLAMSIFCIGLILPITNALNTWGAYLTGKKLFKHNFFYLQIINILYYGGLFVVIFYFPNILPLIIVNFATGLVANIFIYFHIEKTCTSNKDKDPEALSYGKKLSLSNILPMAIYHIDNIAVFHFLGPENLAIYSFASNIPDRFMSLLRPISAIAFPKFASKSADEIKNILPRKLLQFSFISMIVGVIYFIIAPFIYNYLFPQYLESLPYSKVYIIVAILSTVTSLSITALFANRSPNIFIVNVLNPIIGIGIIIFSAYWFGIWGVIIGRILSNTFNLTSNTFFVYKK